MSRDALDSEAEKYQGTSSISKFITNKEWLLQIYTITKYVVFTILYTVKILSDTL